MWLSAIGGSEAQGTAGRKIGQVQGEANGRWILLDEYSQNCDESHPNLPTKQSVYYFTITGKGDMIRHNSENSNQVAADECI